MGTTKFKDMIQTKEFKSRDKIDVQCFDCNSVLQYVAKEHKRTCSRQSKYFNEYRCAKCARKHPAVIEARRKSASHLKSKEFRDACSKRSKKLWENPEFRDKCIKNTPYQSKSKSDKISKSIKKKFRNDQEYIIKIKKARKKYWESKKYRDKQKRNYKELKKYWEHNRSGFISKLQKVLYSILDDLSIDYIIEYKLGFYHFDCFIAEHKLLIECNGEYWHNRPEHIKNDKSKLIYIQKYHPDYKFISLWENIFFNPSQIRDIVLYHIGKEPKQIDFDFHDAVICDIDNKIACEFISKYHYSYSIGHGRSQIRFGVKLDNKVIAVCCFASVTRNESLQRLGLKSDDVRELTRFCIHPEYQKKNFSSWFLSRCMKQIKVLRPKTKCLLSFSDTTFGHDGTIYKASGWESDGFVKPSYWYLNKLGYPVHKKTLYNHARSLSMKEREYAEKHGYLKIKGKKKNRFIFRYEN